MRRVFLFRCYKRVFVTPIGRIHSQPILHKVSISDQAWETHYLGGLADSLTGFRREKLIRIARIALVIGLATLLYKPEAPMHFSNQAEPTRVETKAKTEPVKKAKSKARAVKEPKPIVAERVVSHPQGCENYRQLVSQYSWNTDVALSVMKAESGCNPTAIGDSHLTYWQGGEKYGMSCGMFQVRYLPGRPNCEQMQEPSANIAYAHNLYASGGWGHWSVCNKGIVYCN